MYQPKLSCGEYDLVLKLLVTLEMKKMAWPGHRLSYCEAICSSVVLGSISGPFCSLSTRLWFEQRSKQISEWLGPAP
jgi:hypothetical protein